MTDPEDQADREALYHESKAFTRLTGRLKSLANEAIMEEEKASKQQQFQSVASFKTNWS
jgi:hypothetical protein